MKLLIMVFGMHISRSDFKIKYADRVTGRH